MREEIIRMAREKAYSVGDDSLSLTNEALIEIVQQYGEKVREKCADVAECYNGKQGEHDGTAIGHLIRAMPLPEIGGKE